MENQDDLKYSLGGNLSNFSSYNLYMRRYYQKNVENSLQDFLQNLEIADGAQSSFFDEKITYNRLTTNGTIIEETMSIFEAYLINGASFVARGVTLSDLEFNDYLSNANIQHFIRNYLEMYPMTIDSLLESLYTEIDETIEGYEGIEEFIAYSTYLILCVILTLFLYALFSIRSKFIEVFNSFTSLGEDQFENRINELRRFDELIHIFEKSNYFEDIMGNDLRIGHKRKDLRQQKIAKRYAINMFLFGMGRVILIKFIYVSCLIGLFIFRYLNTQESILSVEHSLDSLVNIYDITTNELVGYNALLQNLIVGNNSKYNSISITEFIKNRPEDSFKRYEKISSLIKLDGENLLNLSSAIPPSICSFFIMYEAFGELCTVLDEGIPNKGIMQANYRSNQILDELYQKMIETNLFYVDQIINSQVFINWQFTLTTLYTESNLYYSKIISKSLQSTILKLSGELESVFIIFELLLFILSVPTIRYTSSFITYKINTLKCAFKAHSVESLIECLNTRMSFLGLMRLNRRYF